MYKDYIYLYTNAVIKYNYIYLGRKKKPPGSMKVMMPPWVEGISTRSIVPSWEIRAQVHVSSLPI